MRGGLAAMALMIGLWALPATAGPRGHLSTGMVVWSQATDLKVDSAVDFDGSNQTAEQRAKDWSERGSGTGIRVGYDFPGLVSLYGEVTTAQMTMNTRDITDPSLSVDSRGMDQGHHLALGARVSGALAKKGAAFWSAGAAVSTVSTSLDQATGVTLDLDATSFHLDGRLGTEFRSVGLYGGLRYAQSDADFKETDRTQSPGQQVRTVTLNRDNPLDVLLGAQTSRQGIRANVEVGLVGTFSAEAALSLQF